MATVTFPQAFRRHVDCPDQSFAAATVDAALTAYFAAHPQVRGYVVDDTGAIRRHVTIFADERQLTHREALATAIDDDTTLYVFQALSGG